MSLVSLFILDTFQMPLKLRGLPGKVFLLSENVALGSVTDDPAPTPTSPYSPKSGRWIFMGLWTVIHHDDDDNDDGDNL